MQSNNNNGTLLKNIFAWEKEYLQKGRRIIFEGEEAYVIRVKPLLVIKTKSRVVCGNLQKKIKYPDRNTYRYWDFYEL